LGLVTLTLTPAIIVTQAFRKMSVIASTSLLNSYLNEQLNVRKCWLV